MVLNQSYFFEIGSTESTAHWLTVLVALPSVSLGSFGLCLPTTKITGMLMLLRLNCFIWVLGIETQIFTFGQQAGLPLEPSSQTC